MSRLALLLALTACTEEAVVPAPVAAPGTYAAWLDAPGGALRFGLELTHDEGWTGAIRNGRERIELDEVREEAGSLVLDIAHYDATIVATPGPGGLEGSWRKTKPAGKVDTLPFHASLAKPEFASPSGSVDGRWKVAFSSDEANHAVGLFTQAADGSVEGTFLTTLGDYRFLAGRMEGDQLTLSAFDGAHAFLFTATRDEGGLSGDFWSGGSWHETWTATPDAEVSLPDPLGLTTAAEAVAWSEYRFPDLEGSERALSEWSGKPRLIQVMGSWCPNCNDQTDLLVELEATYRGRGLEVVSVAFEHGEPTRNTAVVRRYRDYHQAPWTYLLGGPTAKSEASKRVPFLDEVRSYPTLLFVDREDRVRAVYTGFTGEAAPEEHAALRGLYTRLIEELLAE